MAGAGYRRMAFTYEHPDALSHDVVGQADLTYSEIFTLRGTVTPETRDVIDDLGVAVRTEITIECSYDSRIKTVGRLIGLGPIDIDGKPFSIISVSDPDNGRQRRLRIRAAFTGPSE